MFGQFNSRLMASAVENFERSILMNLGGVGCFTISIVYDIALRFAPKETNRLKLNDIGVGARARWEDREVWVVTHTTHKLPSYYPPLTVQTWNKLKCCLH